MKIKFLLLFNLVFLFSGSIVSAKVLATVNGKEITSERFQKEFLEVQSQSLEPPTKKEFLEDLVRFELGLQAAQKSKISDHPDFKKIVEQKMFQFWLDQEVAPMLQSIKISDKDLQTFYKKSPDLHIKQIFFYVSPEATAEQIKKVQERADHVYKGLKAQKRTFSEYAKIYSDDSSTKNQGGDLGPRSINAFKPKVYQTANQLKLGDISPPFKDHNGFYIVKLMGKVPFNKTEQAILRLNVYETKRKQVVDKFFSQLKTKHKIRYSK